MTLKNEEHFTKKLDEIVDTFRKEMRAFADGGDARDDIPNDVEKLESLIESIRGEHDLLKQVKEKLICTISEKIRVHKKVIDLAEEHQISMQDHESGKEYYIRYGRLLGALETL